MKIYIRSMVSKCCVVVVQDELMKLGIPFTSVKIGSVESNNFIDHNLRKSLSDNLSRYGLEVVEDKSAILVEQIKGVLSELIHLGDEPLKTTYSSHISDQLGLDYTYLSNVFSASQGMSIQRYIILNRVERAKQMLLQGDLSLKEISYLLNYSSVAHLSGQFKKVTGFCPSVFKETIFKRQSFAHSQQ